MKYTKERKRTSLSEGKLAESSQWVNIFIAKPVERLMPWTNQHISQFACAKHKYHQLQKNSNLSWSIWAGVGSSGFSELVCETITKTFQRIWKTMRSFSLLDFKKTNSTIDSPADTCGSKVPQGLKVSLLLTRIGIWWRKKQDISLVLAKQGNDQEYVKKEMCLTQCVDR